MRLLLVRAIALIVITVGSLTATASASAVVLHQYVGTVGGYATYARNCTSFYAGTICNDALQRRQTTSGCIIYGWTRSGRYSVVYGAKKFEAYNSWYVTIEDRRFC